MNTPRRFVENIHTTTLEDHGFRVYSGWDEEVERQLPALSRQKHIVQSTERDSLERFTSPEAAHRWYDDHERHVYTLDTAPKLGRSAVAGIIWFGRSELADSSAEYTFAIRFYEASQGKKLSTSFVKAAHTDFYQQARYEGDIWLQTDTTNTPALSLYAKTGYEVIDETDGRITMIKPGAASSQNDNGLIQ